jgi:sterol desaturase/sphingolipid hydroxylase (fatty acid hydroxylase superfamily)
MLDYYYLIVGTYAITSLICFVLDIIPYTPFKNNKINKTLTRGELLNLYKRYLPRVLFNLTIAMLPTVYLYNTFPIVTKSPFSIIRFIKEFIVTYITTDILFYTTHRIMHIPIIYKFSHKKHHEVHVPIGMSAIYTDTFDFYLGNIIPSFLPAYLIMTNPLSFKIWIVNILINTVSISHSGYKNWSEFHDIHHTQFRYNYGINVFMDRLFNTYYYT